MTRILTLVYHRKKNSRMAIYLEHLFKEVLLKLNPNLIYITPASFSDINYINHKYNGDYS